MNEIDKENTNPSPRSSKADNTHFQHDPALFKDQIESYEAQVLVENLDQRINAWFSYLNYCKQFDKSELKVNKITMQDLYRRAIEKCKGVLQTRPNDEQYTKIFVDYTIKYDTNPLKMFKWGHNHRIGESQSYYHIEWAKLLVKSKMFDKAIEVLEGAIAKKASPINILQEYLQVVHDEVKTSLEKGQATSDVVKEVPKASVSEAETICTTSEKHGHKVFSFYYDLINPNRKPEEEFSFEEIRARVHYQNHEESLKYEAKYEAKYIDEISKLKSTIVELQGNQINNPKADNTEKLSRLNKARDSIMLPRNYKQSLLANQDYTGEDTTLWNNLTNVTKYNLSDTCDGDATSSNQTLGDVDFGEIQRSNDGTKHKMMCEDTIGDMTGLTGKFNDKSSMMMGERSMDTLQPPAKKCNFSIGDETGNGTLFTGGQAGNSMMTSCLPTPSIAGKTMSETRNLIENVFNQTDTIYNKTDTFDNVTASQEKSSIFVYQDKNYEETMKFPKMSELKQNRNEDFSIFADQQESMIKLEKPKKTNEDGSLFMYPTSAENSMDNKRKPFRTLTESSSDERSNSPTVNADISDFDPPMMASTCNFKQLRANMKPGTTAAVMQFEPPSSSTCNFKNLKASKDSHERLLETILDTTDADTTENQSDMEKEKLFNKFLGNIDSELKECKDSPVTGNSEKTISNILAEEMMNTQSIKGGSGAFSKEDKVKPTEKTKTNMTTNKTIVGNNITWDDFDMGEVNESNRSSEVIDSKVFTFSPLQNRTEPSFALGDTPGGCKDKVESDDENKLLTQEKLNQTFNKDCYKLFFNGDISMAATQNFTKINFNKMVEDQMSELNHAEEAEMTMLAENDPSLRLEESLMLDKTQQTLSNDKIKADKLLAAMQDNTTTHQITLNPETVTNPSNNNKTTTTTTTTTMSMKSHMDQSSFDPDCSSLNMTTTNMNNTIFNAIKDPFDTDIKNRLLKRSAGTLLQNKNYKNLIVQHPMVKEKHTVLLMDGETYTILEMIGKGAFANIYLIQNKLNKEKSKKKYALKVDTQATAWEFHITEAIHERLKEMVKEKKLNIDVRKSYIHMDQFIKYKNGCFSAMNFYPNGSLLDLINYHVENEQTFPYWFVLYLTLEMLNILDYLHKCNVIHADIKADNFLIDQLPNSIEYFEPHKTKCLVLIDFNRSIDLKSLPEDAQFEAKAANKSLLCPEMKSNKTWTYQVDYYGILSCIHCIIFKKYLNVSNSKGRNIINTSFPRAYDKVYMKMFDCFLNIPDCSSIPDIEKEWIPNFVMPFKTELGTSFCKFQKYLKDLNAQPLRKSKLKK